MTPIIFNFLIDCGDKELENYKNLQFDNTGATILASRGDFSWCLQTYLILSKRKNIQVECSNRFLKDAINIIHSDHLIENTGNSSYFIVCVQADFPKREWANYHIVQNKNQVRKNAKFIPLWSQPKIVRRDVDRKEVKTVAYAGQTFNGNLAGNFHSWSSLLAPHHLNFVTLSDGSWHDLSSIDVLIGIRSFDKNPYDKKPPTKLINAWLANIPFVGGYDSAYNQVGIAGEDYLLVCSQTEALSAILKLRDDSDLYNRIVQNGINKSKQFSTDKVSEIWEETLGNEILNRYQSWNKNRFSEKIRFSVNLNIGLIKHFSKKTIKKIIHFFQSNAKQQ